MESHPFTISTASDSGNGVQLVVKRAGDWTSAVYDLAMRDPAGVKVRCSLEGPYGVYRCLAECWNSAAELNCVGGPLNFTFPAFASVMVVVGGSGSK